MVERMNPVLPISQQCRLLVVPRSTALLIVKRRFGLG
jgi:hypothetical protein